jgi:hypothetical protein
MLLCLDTDADLDGNERDSEPGKSKPLKKKVAPPQKPRPMHPELKNLGLKIREANNFKITNEEAYKILGFKNWERLEASDPYKWVELTKKLNDEINLRKSNLNKGGD